MNVLQQEVIKGEKKFIVDNMELNEVLDQLFENQVIEWDYFEENRVSKLEWLINYNVEQLFQNC